MASKSNPNFNRSIKVSESTIQGLRAGKTFQGNVAKFKASGMTTEQREAMNRFYGKGRVAKAFGSSDTSSHAVSGVTGKVRRATTDHGSAVAASRAASRAPQVRTSSTNSMAKKVGSFAANELLGIDDMKNVASHLRHRQFKAAAKSVGEATVELGSTAASLAAALPTGGGSLAARGAMIAAKQGAKTTAKKVAVSSVKSGAKKAVVGGAKAVATGSPLKGAKMAGKAVIGAPKGIRGAVRGAKGAVRSGMAQADKLGSRATATRRVADIAKRNAEEAAGAYSKAQKAHKAGWITSSELSSAKSTLTAAQKANRSFGTSARNASAKVTQRAAVAAAKKARNKAIAKGGRRATYVRGGVATYNKNK